MDKANICMAFVVAGGMGIIIVNETHADDERLDKEKKVVLGGGRQAKSQQNCSKRGSARQSESVFGGTGQTSELARDTTRRSNAAEAKEKQCGTKFFGWKTER